jgi:hypothetical protein
MQNISQTKKISFNKGKRSPTNRSPKPLRIYKNRGMKDVTNLDSGIFHDYFNRKKPAPKKKKGKFERPRNQQHPLVTQRIKKKIHNGAYSKILKSITPTNDLGHNFIFPRGTHGTHKTRYNSKKEKPQSENVKKKRYKKINLKNKGGFLFQYLQKKKKEKGRIFCQ